MLSIAQHDENSSEATTNLFAPAPGVASLIRQGAITLSPMDAEKILKAFRYERQTRDQTAPGRDHVLVLADIMARGQWRPWDKIDFARLNGRYIILNGHHRLGAQSVAGQPIDWFFVVHECADEEEVAALYYSFDTNVRQRTNGTILAAHGTSEILGVTKMTAEAVFRAMPLIAANFNFGGKSRDPIVNRVIDRRIELMKAFQREAQSWENAVRTAPVLVKRKLANQGALAVALMTLRYQPNAAESFWRGVSENDGLRKGDPRHTYLTALQQTASQGTSHVTARQAAVAWNAWYRRSDLKIIKVIEGAPFRISGTPVGR